MDLLEYSELQVKLVFAIPRGEGEGAGGGEGGGEGKGGGCVNVNFFILGLMRLTSPAADS